MIRFYLKNGRWKVTSDKTAVPAREWWNAINQVKCLNHQLRMKEQKCANSRDTTQRGT